MDLCKEANEIAHNVVLKVIYITMIIISMAAIVTEVWVMFKITNLFLNASSISIIVTERATATYFSSKYEKFGKSIAIILIMAQVMAKIGLYMIANRTI
ncbi:tRNA (guanine-N(7)-)-methyltransferase [Dirofilaria immitis]